MVVEKAKYQSILDKIEAKKQVEKQTAFVLTPARREDDFFREFTDAAGAENF